eukprot:4130138-Pleurochrysis_carterae.AAC.2
MLLSDRAAKAEIACVCARAQETLQIVSNSKHADGSSLLDGQIPLSDISDNRFRHINLSRHSRYDGHLSRYWRYDGHHPVS